MQNQENILKRIYFDPSGFQSQQQLYSEAKKQHTKNTSQVIKEWYLKNVEKQDNPTSSIIKGPNLRENK